MILLTTEQLMVLSHTIKLVKVKPTTTHINSLMWRHMKQARHTSTWLTTQNTFNLQEQQQTLISQLESLVFITILKLRHTSSHIQFWDLKQKIFHSLQLKLHLKIWLWTVWNSNLHLQMVLIWLPKQQLLLKAHTTQVGILQEIKFQCSTLNLLTLERHICLVKHTILTWSTHHSLIRLEVHTFITIMQHQIQLLTQRMVNMTSHNLHIQQQTTLLLILFQCKKFAQLTTHMVEEASLSLELTLFQTQWQ